MARAPEVTARGAALVVPGVPRVEMGLVKANAEAKIEGLDRISARTDYFVRGREHWRTGINNYSRVAYRDVYPGIDVSYYGNQRSLEYDFVVQPGADPGVIRLWFSHRST